MAKRVLVLSYWGLADGLTQGTVLPHALIISAIKEVAEIILVTVEREVKPAAAPRPLSFQHFPLYSKNMARNVINKVNDFLVFPKQLKKLVEKEKIDAIVAFGTLAGSLAYLSGRRSGTPYYVVCCEPHSTYMLESGVWKRWDLRYLFQVWWEKKQTMHATGLATVSHAYAAQLTAILHVPEEKVRTLANGADLESFSFSASGRGEVRASLGIDVNAFVGIYVGKFGDLYYKAEAFEIYKKCFKLFPAFFLIILTQQDAHTIERQLEQHQIDRKRVYMASVPHHEVAAYLSAADFAFATYKPGPSKRFLSPVKIGEYWANGLPVLLTDGIGDDSAIIKSEGGGAVFNLAKAGSLEQALQKINAILQEPNHRQEIARLAQKYRSFDRVREAYAYFFGEGRESA